VRRKPIDGGVKEESVGLVHDERLVLIGLHWYAVSGVKIGKTSGAKLEVDVMTGPHLPNSEQSSISDGLCHMCTAYS